MPFYFLLLNCATYFMFISLRICSNIYIFYVKVKILNNSMARERFIYFNLAGRLKKLPTPDLEAYKYCHRKL